MLLGTLIYGFINSVILALVALGFNLTFGISGVANFSYGALYVLAGYGTWIFMNKMGLSYFIAIPMSILLTALIGALLYRLILLRIRGLVVSEVIATFGIGLAILEMFRYLGFIGYEYTLPTFVDGGVAIGTVFVDFQRLLIVGIGIGLALFLWIFTHHTKIGLAFRGIAQEERTALALGIDSDWMATLSVAFGAGLAAVAAVGILPLGIIAVDEGYNVLLNALAVCIVGGLGSTGGVILASFLLGYAQVFTANYLETHWTIIVSLTAILLILAVKPSGLFGKQKELEERI